jgi:hypothetical protein
VPGVVGFAGARRSGAAAQLAPLPTGAELDWSIQGHDFAPYGLVPYDPAFADEIEASIQAYLDSR